MTEYVKNNLFGGYFPLFPDIRKSLLVIMVLTNYSEFKTGKYVAERKTMTFRFTIVIINLHNTRVD